MTTADEHRSLLPVYLVNWVIPRQHRDPQKAAAAVGTGSLIQLAGTVLRELHGRTGTVELGLSTPRIQVAVMDALEEVRLERSDTVWDTLNRVGYIHYEMDHDSWPERVLVSAQVQFCPGCLGRGGAHAEGCWAAGKTRPEVG